MGGLRVGRIVFVAAIVLGSAFTVFAPTRVVAADHLIKDLIHAYLLDALSEKNRLIVKFDGDGSIPASIDCEELDNGMCRKNFSTLLSAARGNKNFHLNFLEAPAKIVFVSGKSSLLSNRIVAAKEEFKDGFSDTSYPDCQVFLLEKDSIITKSEVIVADDQPVLQQQICYAVLTQVAVGLKPYGDQSFASLWDDSPLSLKKFKPEDLASQTINISKTLYIHSCSQITPGMNSSQVEAALSDEAGCLKPFIEVYGKE